MAKGPEYVPIPDGTPRDTDPMHVILQDHIKECSWCQSVIVMGRPRGFGQGSQMCDGYKALIQMFANAATLDIPPALHRR